MLLTYEQSSSPQPHGSLSDLFPLHHNGNSFEELSLLLQVLGGTQHIRGPRSEAVGEKVREGPLAWEPPHAMSILFSTSISPRAAHRQWLCIVIFFLNIVCCNSFQIGTERTSSFPPRIPSLGALPSLCFASAVEVTGWLPRRLAWMFQG